MKTNKSNYMKTYL